MAAVRHMDWAIEKVPFSLSPWDEFDALPEDVRAIVHNHGTACYGALRSAGKDKKTALRAMNLFFLTSGAGRHAR